MVISRLIDADKLIKDIVNLLQPARPDETEMYKVDDIFWSLEKLIKEQPTAYDVDKVVEQLEGEKEIVNGHKFINKNCFGCEGCIDCKMEDAYRIAIEIVRKGGIDERCK